MDSFLVWLGSFSDPVLDDIIGGISGALVLLLFRSKTGQRALDRWREGPLGWVPLWVPVVSVVIVMSIEISQVLVPRLHAQSGTEAIIRDIEKKRLFKIIFQYHPEAKDEMRSGFQKIDAGPREQVQVQSQLLGFAMSARYYNLHVATASDAAIHNVLENNSQVMEALKTKPESCVSLFLETGHVDRSVIPASLLQAMLDAKADVIESSAKTPVQRENLTEQQLGIALNNSYRENGFEISELEKLSSLESLPVVDGCTIVRHFSAVLASMDDKSAASVYVSLIAKAH